MLNIKIISELHNEWTCTTGYEFVVEGFPEKCNMLSNIVSQYVFYVACYKTVRPI